MRAALTTTAIVIAALAIWAGMREAGPMRDLSTLERGAPPSPPDVAAAPRGVPPAPDPDAAASPSYTTAIDDERPLREYVVVEGDTLETIAVRHYGDASRADAIYEANRDQIRDPAHLHTGQTLILP